MKNLQKCASIGDPAYNSLVDKLAISLDTPCILSMLKYIKPLLFAMAVAFIGSAAMAQNTNPTPPTVVPAQSPAATPVASPTPIPLSEITAQILSAEQDCGKIEAEVSAELSRSVTDGGPSALAVTISAALADSEKKLTAGPSLETIQNLETLWKNNDELQSAAQRNLNDRVKRCEDLIKRLDSIDKTRMEQTASLDKIKDAPPELSQRLRALKNSTQKIRGDVQKRRTDLVLLLPLAQKQDGQISDMLDAIKKARKQAVGRLFERDNMPIWAEPLRMGSGFCLSLESQAAWTKEWASLQSYTQSRFLTFFIHAGLFALLFSSLCWARKRVRAWADDEPRLKQAALVFEVPLSMSIAFSLLAANWIYTEAPRLLAAIGGAAALIPAILILRRLVHRHLFPVLNAMVVFYCVDQLRTVAAAVPLAGRLVFITEMLGGVLFLAWLLKTGSLAPEQEEDQRLAKATIIGVRFAVSAFLAAILASGSGYTQLGNLIGNAALKSGYFAVVLYAATRVIDGLIIGALSLKPVSELGMVRRYRTLLWHRTHRLFEVAAFFAWIAGSLEMFTLRAPLVDYAKSLLFSWHKIGDEWKSDLTLLGQVVSFGAVVWAAFLLSRFLRFVMEEDFYPRVKMERGLSYAISTMLHYAVLLLGFYFAASATGIDMTKFTILAGAFGVGMGFGLQNIINNFVSGIILLFERPVKVGDVVQMNDISGVVDRIGIRASIIRTAAGSEIIVPNGKLISDQVINWTFSNRQRGIDIVVAVAATVDPCRVMEILTRVAKAHPLVSTKPQPTAQLIDLGADALQYKLCAWTDCIEQWGQIRSDLAVAINAEFVKEGIRRMAIPAPATPV